MRRNRRSWLADAVAGAIAGGAATWVMDRTTSGMLQGQPSEVTKREEAAQPNGRSSVANLVARVDSSLQLGLGKDDSARLSSLVHYALGIVPGAAYAVASRRLPILRAGGGLGYGLALWALNDEWLNSALGLSAPFGAYPWETHWRGAVGHAVLGTMTEAGLTTLRS